MSRNSPLLLLTPESYQTKYHGGGPPSALSVILTTLVGLVFFCSLEQVARLFLYQNKVRDLSVNSDGANEAKKVVEKNHVSALLVV